MNETILNSPDLIFNSWEIEIHGVVWLMKEKGGKQSKTHVNKPTKWKFLAFLERPGSIPVKQSRITCFVSEHTTKHKKRLHPIPWSKQNPIVYQSVFRSPINGEAVGVIISTEQQSTHNPILLVRMETGLLSKLVVVHSLGSNLEPIELTADQALAGLKLCPCARRVTNV